MNAERYLPLALLTAFRAGLAIQEIYDTDFSVDLKNDRSPLTKADKRAHEVISSMLKDTFPLLSEEGKHTPYEERKHWTTFWLIDPLDGTKEFIKRNGEFTVNIALIHEGTPILGVVYVPVSQKIYWGLQDKGSFTADVAGSISAEQLDELISSASSLNEQALPEHYTIVASRSHLTSETETFIDSCREKYGEVNIANYGSSLKLCMVAERKAHIYPRLAPTMEWDTAAAHAVAKYAGCKVYDHATGKELVYNKEDLLNPWFIVEAFT